MVNCKSHLAAALALALASSVHATISVTFPVASSTCTGGQACGPIKWQIDDSVAPLGESFGSTSVGIYTGSVNQQTLFLDIGTVSDPTQMLELPSITVPANLGPNGDFYFIRFQSNEAIDPTTGYPLQAFSAKFTLTGMTGQLSPEASAQIAGSIIPTSASSRTLANTRSTAGLASSGSASATTGTRGIGANAQTTANTTVAKVQDTGAAMTGMNMAKTASLAAFMGTAAYLAL